MSEPVVIISHFMQFVKPFLEVDKYIIALLVGSSSDHACSHYSDKLGGWNSSSC